MSQMLKLENKYLQNANGIVVVLNFKDKREVIVHSTKQIEATTEIRRLSKKIKIKAEVTEVY